MGTELSSFERLVAAELKREYPRDITVQALGGRTTTFTNYRLQGSLLVQYDGEAYTLATDLERAVSLVFHEDSQHGGSHDGMRLGGQPDRTGSEPDPAA